MTTPPSVPPSARLDTDKDARSEGREPSYDLSIGRSHHLTTATVVLILALLLDVLYVWRFGFSFDLSKATDLWSIVWLSYAVCSFLFLLVVRHYNASRLPVPDLATGLFSIFVAFGLSMAHTYTIMRLGSAPDHSGRMGAVLVCLGVSLFSFNHRRTLLTVVLVIGGLFLYDGLMTQGSRFFLFALAFCLAAGYLIALNIHNRRRSYSEGIGRLVMLRAERERARQELATMRERCRVVSEFADKLNSPICVIVNTIQLFEQMERALDGRPRAAAGSGVGGALNADVESTIRQMMALSNHLAELRELNSVTGESRKSLFETTLLISSGMPPTIGQGGSEQGNGNPDEASSESPPSGDDARRSA